MSFLTRWAPVIRFHQAEDAFPSSVEWYLERATLVGEGGDQVLDPPGAVINGTTRKDSSALADPRLYSRSGCFLNLMAEASRSGDLTGARCYGYERPVSDENGTPSYIDLTYWIFYPYNGNTVNMQLVMKAFAVASVIPVAVGAMLLMVAAPLFPVTALMLMSGYSMTEVVALLKRWRGMGLHEGDWEHITVRVTPDGNSVEEVYFSQHADGGWTKNFDTVAGGRPIAYVAKHSHAMYSKSGTTTRLAGFASDDHPGNGQEWDTKDVMTDVGYDSNVLEDISWQNPVALKFGSSGDGFPVVSTNGETLLEVHKGGDAYWYQVGTFDPSSAIITWSRRNGKPHGGGSGHPCVSLTREQFFVSAYRNDEMLYYELGVVAADSTIGWLTSGGIAYDGGTGDPWIALNSKGQVIEVHTSENGEGRLHAFYGVGSLAEGGKSIDWRVKGVDYGMVLTAPSVAMNQRGLVVEAHWTAQSPARLVYSCAHIDELHDGKGWSFSTSTAAYQLGTARALPDNVSVTLNDDGVLMAVYQNGGEDYYLDMGQVDLGNGEILWSVKERNFDRGRGRASVSLADNDKFVVVHRGRSDLYCNGGMQLLSRFAKWVPSNGQYWLKYSGRWGRDSDKSLGTYLHSDLVETTSGPRGPAFKDSWAYGD